MTNPKRAKPKPRLCTLILTVELKYDKSLMHGDDPDARRWFIGEILAAPDGLYLHSNEIGDEIGKIKVLSVGRTPQHEASYD